MYLLLEYIPSNKSLPYDILDAEVFHTPSIDFSPPASVIPTGIGAAFRALWSVLTVTECAEKNEMKCDITQVHTIVKVSNLVIAYLEAIDDRTLHV